MSLTGEGTGEQTTPEQMTKDRIAGYLDAARGWSLIHTFSHNGEIVREVITEAGTSLEPGRLAVESQWFDEGGQITLRYDGVMSTETCAAVAADLESQLSTQG